MSIYMKTPSGYWKQVIDIKTKVNDLRIYDDKYVEVKAITNNGAGYIDTGYKPNTNTKIEMKFALNTSYTTPTNYSYYMFGERNAAKTNMLSGLVYNGNYQYYYGNNYVASSGVTLDTGTHIFYSNMRTANVDGQGTMTNSAATFASDLTIWIGGLNDAGSLYHPVNMTIYYMKIWEGDTFIANFVPVAGSTLDDIGLYDTISNTFRPNLSSTGWDVVETYNYWI